MDQNRIVIFDTTLRDGEQSPGASLNTKEKLEIAKQLVALGVDVIEAGFPITSPGDCEAVSAVASECGSDVVICGLARCVSKDIDAAARALAAAKKRRIHVFLATSEIHRKFKLNKAKEEIVRLAAEGVRYAKTFCDDVEFSPEDASRTEPDFLAQVVETAIAAGATTINIPDTVGYAVPDQFGALIAYLCDKVANIDRCILSVHCHNDLGLAVANSLAAVKAGARQIECTINGLGERAGNCALEEVVMGLRTRRDFFSMESAINTRKLFPISRLVSNLTGIRVQRNKAIVGDNAFAHEAGIHQDGILKEKTTYEIMQPEDIGLVKSTLVLGKHSGRHAFRQRIEEMGYRLSDEEIQLAFDRFKALADKKKTVYDEDLETLIEDEIQDVPELFALDGLHVTSGTEVTPTATARVRKPDGSVVEDAACGDGPVDAVYNAIDRITGMPGRLLEYNIRAVTGGKDALGHVTLSVDFSGRTVLGRASSTDILEASARAYLNAVNRIATRTNNTAE